jgi:hypothetical protein
MKTFKYPHINGTLRQDSLLGIVVSRTTIPPLPEGEGRGEGEAFKLPVFCPDLLYDNVLR